MQFSSPAVPFGDCFLRALGWCRQEPIGRHDRGITDFGKSYLEGLDEPVIAMERVENLPWPPPDSATFEDYAAAVHLLSEVMTAAHFGFSSGQTALTRLLTIVDSYGAEVLRGSAATDYVRSLSLAYFRIADVLDRRPLPDPKDVANLDSALPEEKRLEVQKRAVAWGIYCTNRLMTELEIDNPTVAEALAGTVRSTLGRLHLDPDYREAGIVAKQLLGTSLEMQVTSSTEGLDFERTIDLIFRHWPAPTPLVEIEALLNSISSQHHRFDVAVHALWCVNEQTSDSCVLALIERVLDAVENFESPQQVIEGWARTYGAVWNAISRIAPSRPREATELCYRIAGLTLPEQGVQVHPIMFVIPGAPAAALIDDRSVGTPICVELPDATNERLAEVLTDWAWDGHSRRNARKALKTCLKPIATWLSTSSLDRVRLFPFGLFSLVPFQSLSANNRSLSEMTVLLLPQHQSKWGAHSDGGENLAFVDTSFTSDSESAAQLLERGFSVETFSSEKVGGVEALGESLGESLKRAQSFVFFGHGHVEQHRSEATGLVLGTNKQGQPLLAPASWLESLTCQHLETVVLIACSTGAPSIVVPDSPSVAHSFGRAGARAVIAPIWPIDSATGVKFLEQLGKCRCTDITTQFACTMKTNPSEFAPFALYTA